MIASSPGLTHLVSDWLLWDTEHFHPVIRFKEASFPAQSVSSWPGHRALITDNAFSATFRDPSSRAAVHMAYE